METSTIRATALCPATHSTSRMESNYSPYNRSQLIRFTYQYAPSEQSQDNLLRAFFQAITLSLDDDDDFDFDELRPKFFGFADYLLDNFLLPSRVSALRGECLLRDRYRCVVSWKFDMHEATTRFNRDNDNARDDDGNLLEGEPLDSLEVAHILPHSLTKVNANHELDSSREAALAVLNMFDHGVTHLIEGTDIDQPRNTLTLTHQLHLLFGDFKIFFEPVQDEQQSHTYRVDSLLHPSVSRTLGLPITRTLYLTDTRTIDPSSPRLLAVHRAIAHILHLSGAREYIDRLLRDMDEKGILGDGSTDVGRLVKLSLSGWLDGSAMCN
ncbi:hypothetical protein F5X98DRAFT_360154 [Xylaria grammica]|nr:hypothetical protein F5X98DRAFT_360154 [Xylaria grammica]